MGKSNTLGSWGEDLAANYLERKGYRLLKRNYKSRYGEIDLVVFDGDYLIFVEVKLRKSAGFAAAAEFVDRRKQDKLRTTAEFWLIDNPTELQPRFDVIEIYAPYGTNTQKPQIFHWEDAFQ